MNNKSNSSSEKLRTRFNSDTVVGHVFAAPFIFGFVCFSLIPICMSLYYAFTDYSLGNKQTVFVGLKNFTMLFKD